MSLFGTYSMTERKEANNILGLGIKRPGRSFVDTYKADVSRMVRAQAEGLGSV